jgi:hypothetical protein
MAIQSSTTTVRHFVTAFPDEPIHFFNIRLNCMSENASGERAEATGFELESENGSFSGPKGAKPKRGSLRPFPFLETHHKNQNSGNSSDPRIPGFWFLRFGRPHRCRQRLGSIR